MAGVYSGTKSRVAGDTQVPGKAYVGYAGQRDGGARQGGAGRECDCPGVGLDAGAGDTGGQGDGAAGDRQGANRGDCPHQVAKGDRSSSALDREGLSAVDGVLEIHGSISGSTSSSASTASVQNGICPQNHRICECEGATVTTIRTHAVTTCDGDVAVEGESGEWIEGDRAGITAITGSQGITALGREGSHSD